MDKPREKKSEPSQITPFWRDWTEFDRALENFRRDFERSFISHPAFVMPTLSITTPSCDVVDEGDRYVINTEMPGVKKEDIKLNLTENTVEISAEHKEEEKEKKKNFIRKERREVAYHRTLPLPEKVDTSKAKAQLNNGILSIEIPKVNPTPKPKSVSISIQ